MKIFIDTHSSFEFGIGRLRGDEYRFLCGIDTASEMIPLLHQLVGSDEKIDSIVLINGPGSLTGLRIGASFALGIAAGTGIPIQSLTLWDILLEEGTDVYFYTGTKKWAKRILKNGIVEELIVTIDEIVDDRRRWVSNRPDLLTLNADLNVPYPKIIERMPQNMRKAMSYTGLLYPVNIFCDQ
jgi:hypothetical protein